MTVPSVTGLEFDSKFFRKLLVESICLIMIKFCPTNNPENMLFCKVIMYKQDRSKLILFDGKKQSAK
jgi:hypothetical protein